MKFINAENFSAYVDPVTKNKMINKKPLSESELEELVPETFDEKVEHKYDLRTKK